MSGQIHTYLVTTAQDAKAAEGLGVACAYLYYRVGEAGLLQRAQLPITAKGGMMGVYDGGGLHRADPQALAQSIVLECKRRGYHGVILDIEGETGLYQLMQQLSAHLAERGIVHVVPLSMAHAAPHAKILIPSAISGGSFVEMLQSFSARFGASNLCLELVRSCNDFVMPSFSPQGVALSPTDFSDILRKHSPIPYFSREMCSKYFTYRTDGQAHFVLFDDAATAAQKIVLAREHGFFAAFALYSDWGAEGRDIVAHAAAVR